MANERITEDIVRSHFKNDGMFKSIKLEEQRTRHKILKDLLKTASKKGTGKSGFPEFIITFPSIMDLVIIVECKPDTKFHKSKNGEEDPKKYAVDGVLHYAKYLIQDFNVIAIATSGENEENLSVSSFFIRKNTKEIKEIDKKLLSIYDYLGLFEQKENVEKLKDQNLLVFASELNQELYNHSIPENERATIVSGILIALQNKSFRKSYDVEKRPSDLVEDLLKAIKRVLEDGNMGERTKILMGEYSKILQSNNLAISDKIRDKKTGEEEKNTLLRDLISELDKKVFPFTKYEHIGYDILGQFYSEFIRYVYGDKKLGLVLTPQHITELFVDIANLDIQDIVYDNCCGTAGFLIKGMKKLLKLAENNSNKQILIKNDQLIGVEERSDMFTYACSNMMMRGDGKSSIYLGDSLSQSVKNKVKEYKPTVGFLNPPYATSVSELEFIYHNLDCLEKNGVCVAIIPISCVLSQSGKEYDWKKKLLEKHTLEAVFSMPDELFNPTSSTITAIVVFKAHITHSKNYETYFGYWKDDGFVKMKNLGRVDYYGKWNKIKSDWVFNYRNKKEIAGHNIKKVVSVDDEWCVEIYMETNYGALNEEYFEKNILYYLSFLLTNFKLKNISSDCLLNRKINLDIKNWQYFTLDELFVIQSGKGGNIYNLNIGTQCPYISSTSTNNGVIEFVNAEESELHKGNTITVNRTGSVGEAFFQPFPFVASRDRVRVLIPKFTMNNYIGLFLSSIIRLEKYRFNYGRTWGTNRIKESKIKLPTDKNGVPDFEFMESYIKSLPYSSSI